MMMEHDRPGPARQNVAPTINARQETLMVYIIFAVSVFFGLFASLLGVIYAYVRRNDIKDTVYYSHMNYLIRLFWWQLVLGVLGFVGVAYGFLRPLLFDQAPNMAWFFGGIAWFALLALWFLARMVLGFVRFNDASEINVPFI